MTHKSSRLLTQNLNPLANSWLKTPFILISHESIFKIHELWNHPTSNLVEDMHTLALINP